jgi:pimeloyl-ACP methyl ester carboxylesterase
MFVHGLGCSGSIWNQMESLRQDLNIQTPDLPGHGKSLRSDNKCDYGFNALWAYISDIINDTNFSETVLVLHSMSSGILPEIARGTNRPKAVAILEGNLIEDDAIWSRKIQLMEDIEYIDWIKKFQNNSSTVLKSLLVNVHDKEKIHYWSYGYKEVDPLALKTIANEIYNLTSSGAIVNALNELSIPIIFLRGSKSLPWTEGKQVLKKLDIPLALIPSSSHFPMIDNPKAVWSAILNFN